MRKQTARAGRSRLQKSSQSVTLAAGVNNPAGTLSYDQQTRQERPANLNQIFTRCRSFAEESSFLSVFLPLKLAFFNYGFSVALGPESKSKPEELAAWLATELTTDVQFTDPTTLQTTKIQLNTTVGEAIERFVRDVWTEFLLLDNCVGFWLSDGGAPITLPPEKCTFTDKFGLPILFYLHGLSPREILLLQPDQQKRFTQFKNLLLSAEQGEFFKVLKRGLVGSGFAKPSLFALFRTLGEIDSKEQGFHARAFHLRAATRHFKLGHEIKNGLHAGKGTWFWNDKRDKATRAVFKDRAGPHDFTSNFDVAIEFPWPDVATFDETAWKGTDRRLRNWGGPIAQMLVSEKIVEGGLSFLRAQAAQDRRVVAKFLQPIIQAAFKAPDGLDFTLVWSDLIFMDPGKAAELIKFAVQQGLCSMTTAREFIGFNSAREDMLKVKEASDADAVKKSRPLWDTSHGIAPALGETAADLKAVGADPGSTNGRPAGAQTST